MKPQYRPANTTEGDEAMSTNTSQVSGAFHSAEAEQVVARYANWMIGQTQFSYLFETFFHPFVGDLIGKLNQTNIPATLDPQYLGALSRDYTGDYTVMATTQTKGYQAQVTIPKATIDTSLGAPYAVYNWELFYHIPVMIAVHLSQNQRFAEAQN